MSEKPIECLWLNKEYGDGYWICTGKLKPTTEEICRKCIELRENDGGEQWKF